jgi:hypothetical protein
MTILAWLEKFAGASSSLVALLEMLKVKAPDLAPAIDELLAQLNSALDPAALAKLPADLLKEALDIASGRINSKDHPSSLA